MAFFDPPLQPRPTRAATRKDLDLQRALEASMQSQPPEAPRVISFGRNGHEHRHRCRCRYTNEEIGMYIDMDIDTDIEIERDRYRL